MIQKRRKIHTRHIDITTYEASSDTIIVEGVLRDERLFESYRPTGETISPGTIHDMIIRIEVSGPQLIINDIEVEMPTMPYAVCKETLDCLAPVKGMRIISGFSRKVTVVVGGPKKCIHILTLLKAMAHAAVQASNNARTRKPIDPVANIQSAMGEFKNTCWAWRENGPLLEKLEEMFKRNAAL